MCVERLEVLGWEYVPKYEDVMPFRRYFRLHDAGRRMAHLHMVEPAHTFWAQELAFRDRLRVDPEIARPTPG